MLKKSKLKPRVLHTYLKTGKRNSGCVNLNERTGFLKLTIQTIATLFTNTLIVDTLAHGTTGSSFRFNAAIKAQQTEVLERYSSL